MKDHTRHSMSSFLPIELRQNFASVVLVTNLTQKCVEYTSRLCYVKRFKVDDDRFLRIADNHPL
jgi:hypothetical protein